MRYLTLIVVFGIIGLAVGYAVFGQWNGSYVPIQNLIFKPKNILEQAGSALLGLGAIKQKILICGAAGAGLGIIVAALGGKRR